MSGHGRPTAPALDSRSTAGWPGHPSAPRRSGSRGPPAGTPGVRARHKADSPPRHDLRGTRTRQCPPPSPRAHSHEVSAVIPRSSRSGPASGRLDRSRRGSGSKGAHRQPPQSAEPPCRPWNDRAGRSAPPPVYPAGPERPGRESRSDRSDPGRRSRQTRRDQAQ